MTDQTTLSDEQYARLEPLLPARGNHVKIAHRQVLDAWLYVVYQGCTWRGLPREFGDWHTIYVRLNRWAKAGVLERVARLAAGVAGRTGLGHAVAGQHDHSADAHGTGALRNRGAPVLTREGG